MAGLTKSVVVDTVLPEELVPEVVEVLHEDTRVADPREQVIRDWICQAVVDAPPLHQHHFAFYLLDNVGAVLTALDAA